MIQAQQTQQPYPAHALITSLSAVCRHVGTMVAEVETSLIDNAQLGGGGALPPAHLQKMDLIIQSIEELALFLDRFDPAQPELGPAELADIMAPIRLGWIRSMMQDDGGPAAAKPLAADKDIMLF